MVTIHFIIGLAVLVSFLLLTIVNAMRLYRGASYSWARGLSFAASGLLLLQYVLGFGLLGSDHRITAAHYILALAVIVPVGAEHMIATQQETDRDRIRIAFYANLAALILVAVVYEIGRRNS